MRRLVAAAALLCLTAAPARAQGDLLRSCAQELQQARYAGLPAEARNGFQQMCVQAVNSLSALQPGVGITLSGGNPILGTGSTLGTRLGLLPRVSLSARANLALTEMPRLFDKYSASFGEGEALPPMARAGIPLGAVQADLAIGVFNGLALGFGAVDLLGSLSLVPKVNDVGLTESIMNMGGGARIGILKQGILMPGLSVSGTYRKMGKFGLGDLSTHPGAFETDLRNLSLRVVASKGLLILDLAVGAGYDRYSSDVGLGWKITCGSAACRSANDNKDLTLSSEIEGKLETATWNVFANAGLNFIFLHIVGEVGYQKVPDGIGPKELGEAGLPVGQPLMSEALKGGNLFGSIGLRLAI
jgi:hypothetical protein